MRLKPTHFGKPLLRRVAISVASLAVFLLYVLPLWACGRLLGRDRLRLRLDRTLPSYWERVPR